ncbi:hypothetical protein H0H87_012605, partial [Tephrocybe sp. NHM501043]
FKTVFLKKKYILDKRHYEWWLKKDKGKEDIPFKPIIEVEEEVASNPIKSGKEAAIVGFLQYLKYDDKFAVELQQKWSEVV